MNPNRGLYRSLPYMPPLLAAVLYSIVISCSCISLTQHSDTLWQLQQMASGRYTNWWSPFVMAEGNAIYHLISFVCGTTFPLFWVSRVLSIIGVWILFASIALLGWRFAKWDQSYSWVTLPLTLVSASLIFYDWTPSYLFRFDIIGAACIMAAVTVALAFSPKRKWHKALYIFTILLLTAQACELRAPLVLLIPFILWLLICQLRKQSLLKNLLLSVIFSIAFLVSIKLLTSALVPVSARLYPVQIMLQSDMKIAAVLEHDYDFIDNGLAIKEGVSFVSVGGKVSENNYWIAAQFGPTYHLSSQEEWEELKRLYCKYWQQHPLAMLESRMLQSIQFLTGGYTPHIIRYAIHFFHPHVKPDCGDPHGYVWPPYRIVKPHYVAAFLIWLCGTWLPMRHYFNQKKSGEAARHAQIGLILGCICFFSLACYFIVVPTGDYRFRLQTVLLGTISLAWWWCIRKREKLHLNSTPLHSPATRNKAVGTMACKAGS